MLPFRSGVAIVALFVSGLPLRPPASQSASSRAIASPPFLLAWSGWKSALVPIGRYTGDTWVNTWPEPNEGNVPVPAIESVPFAWLSKPVPRQWTLFLEGRPTRITVTSTRRGAPDSLCTSPAVLSIDRPPSIRDDAYDGGLAVDNNQIVEDVRRLTPADAQWRVVAPVAERTYAQYESRALGAGDQTWFTDALVRGRIDLATKPMVVDAIYQAVTDISAPTFYFVATKRFVVENREYGVVVSGWLRPDVGGRWPAMAVATRTFGGDITGDGLRPLGLLRVLARRFWVMFAPGWESGGFELYEATGTDMLRLLTSSNGAC